MSAPQEASPGPFDREVIKKQFEVIFQNPMRSSNPYVAQELEKIAEGLDPVLDSSDKHWISRMEVKRELDLLLRYQNMTGPELAINLRKLAVKLRATV